MSVKEGRARQSGSGKRPVEALVFDLDGVLTRTRETHRRAWKELFSWYFEQQGQSGERPLSDGDYDRFIDGRPRCEGVRCFLESRQISLPYGHEDDAPGTGSICALGNKKNELFHRVLEEKGVRVYQDAVDRLKDWRRRGLKTAVVSSSRNCQRVMEVAGIDHLFDVRVDGLVAADLGLKGKPNPDIFTEAVRRLGVSPLNAVVFEDAISGVRAGQNGFFALVVGVARFGNKEGLLKQGADICIPAFDGFDLWDPALQQEWFALQGEPLFPENEDFWKRFNNGRPVVFLDYDGTLTPIVSRPEDAILTDSMRDSLKELARHFTVAVVTGRDKEDVERLVGLDGLIYAGSHGYIISGPDGLEMEHEQGRRLIPGLNAMEDKLRKTLKEKTHGVQIDRKRYAIGLHFRNARPGDEKVVYREAEAVLNEYGGFKLGEGKKILEVKPDLDWHKGKAVHWILDRLGLSGRDDRIPVFIGDDITDEDAFRALRREGIGILVGGHGKPTAARYALKNVFQAEAFFRELVRRCHNG